MSELIRFHKTISSSLHDSKKMNGILDQKESEQGKDKGKPSHHEEVGLALQERP